MVSLFFCVGEFVVQYMAHNGVTRYVNGFCTSVCCVCSTFNTLIDLLFVCLFVCLCGLLRILLSL